MISRSRGRDLIMRTALALCFYRGGAVYIADGKGAGVFGFQCPQTFGICHIRHFAPGMGRRQDHPLIRRQDFCGFRHETDTAEDDFRRVGFRRPDGEFQRIPLIIRNILNFPQFIVVSKDNGTPFPA